MNRHTRSTTVTYSYDGIAVINHLKEHLNDQAMLPDYIFVDLNMPVFSGFDFVKLYNEISSSIYKSIQVYIVSSSINPQMISEVLKYPFVSRYIKKPMTKKILEGILNLPDTTPDHN